MKGSLMKFRVLGAGAFLVSTLLIFSCGKDPNSVPAGGSLKGLTSHTPGDLDPTFGAGGIVTTNFINDGSEVISSMVIQPDGKIVAFGDTQAQVSPFQPLFALARYNPDGTLDAGFGREAGMVRTFVGYQANGLDSALAPDGKIVTVGSATIVGSNLPFVFVLAIYDTNGIEVNIVDTVFSGYDFAIATSVVVQPDGKIVAAGTLNGTSIGLVQYNPDGTLDPGFGAAGQVVTPVSGVTSVSISDAALQADGMIVLGGTAVDAAGDDEFVFIRYQSDGSLDSSFGTGGISLINPNTDPSVVMDKWINGIGILGDGKIIGAGGYLDQFALIRTNPDGGLDGSFGSGGMTTTGFSGMSAFGTGVGIQSDGKLVVSGAAADLNRSYFAAARYQPDGSLDTSFGSHGTVTTAIGGSGVANSLVIQADQRIVMGGGTQLPATFLDFALARYNGSSAVADLSLALTESADPILVDETVTYTVTVVNNGPDSALDVTLYVTPPNSFQVDSTPSQGVCNGNVANPWTPYTCDLGTIANGAGATVTIAVTGTLEGVNVLSASVSSAATDPDPSNNNATEETTVTGGGGVTRPTIVRPTVIRPPRPTIVRPPRPSVR